ncbi:unnamed protein product [Victoria cruziana]
MGKLCEGSVLDGFQPVSPLKLPWQDGFKEKEEEESFLSDLSDLRENNGWEAVSGLQERQRRALQGLSSKGVFWKHPSKPIAELFLLFHGGDVDTDGNCLFTASRKAMQLFDEPEDIRKRVVDRFSDDYQAGICPRADADAAIKNMYQPDLEAGWGVHFVQELKFLALKNDRQRLDTLIEDLTRVGVSRESAAEAVYKERCIPVKDADSWAKYMSINGNSRDEYDIITMHYTQEGLLTVDENRDGKAAAFGDDIAIETLATVFEREFYVVQAHGSDGSSDEEACLFFLPHPPRGSQVAGPPVFLLMRGTGWCCAGADHYEPLIAYAAPCASQEKAAVIL